ncbi:MAG TPA: cysteine desulfurase [Thermopetrobacter sp.]|nr:cysteine desulfurase [Thermopetrobacter sp.]
MERPAMTRAVAYLDHNATTPLSDAARAAMAAAWAEGPLNPSSKHYPGQRARAIIEEARESVADRLGAAADEVIFTSGGTEAANLAVRGAPVERFIVSFMEHPAVMKPAKASGRPVALWEVDERGVADLAALKRHLAAGSGRALVCLMLASNETGVIEPLAEAAAIAHEHGALVFCDAVQAAGKMDVDMRALGVDMLAVSAHKFGGPQGAGVLIVREGIALEPLLLGGGQERRLRAGTENVAAIAGLAAALDEALRNRAEKDSHVRRLRDRLESALQAVAPDAVIFSSGAERLSNTVMFAHPALEADVALMAFDLDGVALSAGSACHAGRGEVSRALVAMGADRELARRALRVSLGPGNTEEDIARFAASLRNQLRRAHASAA